MHMPAHWHTRRTWLQGTLAGGLATLGYQARAAEATAAPLRQVLFIWLAGGASQFEMWDPKPGRPTGGPFQAIPTAVPGIEVCELMPLLAQRLDKLTVLRGLSTAISEHEQAADLMSTGRPKEPALEYPELGVVFARELAGRAPDLPDYVSVFRTSEGRRRALPGFLGATQMPVHLERSSRPENIELPADLSRQRFDSRLTLRSQLSQGFLAGRAGRELGDQYETAQRRVPGLMDRADLFDIDREPESARLRYGGTPFGRHCLLARRLIEAGVPVVKVARGFWDSHHDNFESHRELVTDFDHVFSVLLDDLAERGLLQQTLVIVLSEFGRTPKINRDVGRDHYADAWSCVMAGAGAKPGAVYGKTDRDGIKVVDGKVGPGDLVATLYRAAGINPHKRYTVGLRPVPLAPEGAQEVEAVLS